MRRLCLGMATKGPVVKHWMKINLKIHQWCVGDSKEFVTPPKFNMEPENDAFQKESPFSGVDFQVPC